MPTPSSYGHTLRECADLSDEREASYGPIDNNFGNISQICDVVFGLKVSEADLAKIMMATKLSREKNLHKTDNLKDLINYTAILSHFSPDV